MERFRQRPTDDAFVQDPYPHYARMRNAGHLAYWADLDMACAVSNRAVSRILRHKSLGRERPKGVLGPEPQPHLAIFNELEANSLLDLEPPRHTRLRRLITRAFNSNQVAIYSSDISELVDQLIDTFPHGPFDLVTYFTQKLPVIVIAKLLGVPISMAPDFLRWSNAMVALYQSRRDRALEDRAETAAKEFVAFLKDHIADHRRRPRHDLLTELIAAHEDGDALSDIELLSTIVLLLNAGHEATVNALGIGVKLILETDTLASELQPTNVVRTIDEILRFDAPLHMFKRYVYEPVDLFGQRFMPGDEVACLLAAANRDADVWKDPDVFDPRRPVTTSSAFGGGIHFCVGAPLARLELQIALPVLFARIPTLHLTEQPRFANTWHFRGLERLMVSR